ncbi:LOW QUALITY PROTEIN: MESD isoform 3 [Pongo abelii]|uniref:LRP chaperone MESD n=1 Tax=Pongo abelii TaxID=9601 RepID=A0A2J8SKP1_PONAB|nr:LOW QUALITY PROTEIN: MESD isoform 3 [Pongo abelii]
MAASSWARKAVVVLCASDLLLLLLLLPPPGSCAAEASPGTPDESTPPPRKKKKDIRDYNDADMARLLEQWETPEPLPVLPEVPSTCACLSSASLIWTCFSHLNPHALVKRVWPLAKQGLGGKESPTSAWLPHRGGELK